MLENAVAEGTGRFRRTVSCALALVALLSLAHSATAQQMKPVTIATKWAKDVDPSNPVPEYPRPQMVRSQWLNLNGVWQVRSGTADDPVPVDRDLRGKIVVPFPVESALSGVKLHFDRLWYRRMFTIPTAWAGRRVKLPFGGVDYEAEVLVNGKSVGIHRGGYEEQGEFDTAHLVDEVRSLDPSRIVNEASGWKITGAGNLNDVHSYPAPGIRPATATQALVDGEFGGIGEVIPGHAWQFRGDGYINAGTTDDMLYLYAEYLNLAKQYRDADGLSGVIYTQLTDVEQEMNGLLTYDRISKVDPAKIAQANRFELPLPKYVPVVPTSEASPQMWRFTIASPGKEWNQTSFDDGAWTEKRGGFGNVADRIGTPWTTGGIWIRRHFNPERLSAAQLENLVADDIHLGDIQIYINGVLGYSQGRDSVA